MPNIPQTYCSPLTRWALCVEDWPGASHTFETTTGSDPRVNVPAEFGGTGKFLLCVIDFGAGNERKPATGWKPLTGVKPNADEYNIVCTKALGRALKRAGYPDDLDDLRACILWRQRRAEIAAIQGAPPVGALGPGDPLDKALSEAGVSDPDHVGVDDRAEPHRDAPINAQGYDGDDVEDVEDAVLVDPATGEIVAEDDDLAAVLFNPPTEETLSVLRQAITDSAKTGTQSALRAWAKDQGWTAASPPTEQAARFIVHKATELAEAPM